MISSLTSSHRHRSSVALHGFERYMVLGDVVTLLLTGEETNNEFTLYEVTSTLRETITSPLHVHPGATQYYRILEGTISFQRGDEFGTAAAGEIVVMPAGVAHRTWATDPESNKCLVLITPAGIEESFRRVGVPASDSAKPQSCVVNADVENVSLELLMSGMRPEAFASE